MLKYGEPNPLSIFGLRKIEFCPPHFTKIIFDLRVNEKRILDWVYENLEGRFFYGEHYYRDSDGRVHSKKCLAFEEPAESSMFAIVVDTINKHSTD